MKTKLTALIVLNFTLLLIFAAVLGKHAYIFMWAKVSIFAIVVLFAIDLIYKFIKTRP